MHPLVNKRILGISRNWLIWGGGGVNIADLTNIRPSGRHFFMYTILIRQDVTFLFSYKFVISIKCPF